MNFKLPNSPPLRRHGPLQVVSKPVGSIWTFGFTAVEPTLFRVVGMDTSRPLHFDGTNFPYYKARMDCHLKAIDLGVWRVTHDGIKPIKNFDKPTKSEKKKFISMLELKIACLNHLAWMCLTKCSL